jgi:cytochrome c peroxidase
MRIRPGMTGLLLGFALGSACAPVDEAVPFPFELPAGLPEPAIPASNPWTAEKAELGRHLFYDRRLSGNGEQSCADCHQQSLAFSDGRVLSVGSTGDTIPRNAMTLTDVAWWSTYTWMNPLIHTLEEQALVPMFANHPVELGLADAMPEVIAELMGDATYTTLFAAAYPHVQDRFTTQSIIDAIASFERTLVSGRSAYDRYWYDADASALSDSAKLGMDLFFSETAECYHCHAGALFSTAFVAEDSLSAEPAFNNNGLYNLGGVGDYPEPNLGLVEFSGLDVDKGRFRVPTLRNIAVTAPYFHDGSAATLEDVLDHYQRGGRLTETGPNAGDGALNPYKHPLVRGMELTTEERQGLLDFLLALTDEDFLVDPALSDPWAQ